MNRRDAFAYVLIGMIFMAALDYGDVWLCIGECGDVPARIFTEESR